MLIGSVRIERRSAEKMDAHRRAVHPAESAGHGEHDHNRGDFGKTEEPRGNSVLSSSVMAPSPSSAPRKKSVSSAHEVLRGRRREKVELDEVLHAEALQREHDGGDGVAQELRCGLLLRHPITSTVCFYATRSHPRSASTPPGDNHG